jgi:nucleoside-diphosphate-sugar epimerase
VDLRGDGVAARATHGIDTVFHLAAAHGGRGYVDLHQAECAGNLLLDGLVFRAAVQMGVRKVVFASSGCVYPLHLQTDPAEPLFLTEAQVGPPYAADGMYGWAKLMGEMSLRALCSEKGLEAVSCRYFTVYGPRGIENHAIMAMIARAFVEQDPFLVWGDGRQVRNWTYVTDIVRGTILAAERLTDGRAVNLGTSERISVAHAAAKIVDLAGRSPRIEFQPWMPTGPLNRVASFELARELLGWEPSVLFEEGVRRTFDWYCGTQAAEDVERRLPRLLVERGAPA